MQNGRLCGGAYMICADTPPNLLITEFDDAMPQNCGAVHMEAHWHLCHDVSTTLSFVVVISHLVMADVYVLAWNILIFIHKLH